MASRKVIKDTLYYTLIEASSFPKLLNRGEAYIANYFILNKLTAFQTLILSTDSPNEIKLTNNSPLKSREERKLEIQFNPLNVGQKKFQIFIVPPRAEKQILLEKSFYVQDKSGVKIEATVKESLPACMRLGEEKEVVFLFTNVSNQVITGITINIKELLNRN